APCDALIATQWTTAYVARDFQERARRVFYFVQDFEPLFYPMGDEYLRAERTYTFGFAAITAGPWCAKILRDRFGASAEHFELPLDRAVYFPRQAALAERKRVLFFARPDIPRRCFPVGVEALVAFQRRYPDVEIGLFGADGRRNLSLPFRYTDLGILSPNQLAETYSAAYAGLAFSTTNPSLVPFEMMACGLPV